MRTSIDILNYFRRKKRQKEIAKLKRQLKKEQRRTAYFRTKCVILERELDAHKHIQKMYNDLVDVLDNVSEHCALRPTAKIHAPYPLQRIDMQNSNYDSANKMFGYHCVNLYTAEALIQDYEVEECIHFELDTEDGRYCYQYSKKGLDIQTPTRILKQVTQIMASAWYNNIHN